MQRDGDSKRERVECAELPGVATRIDGSSGFERGCTVGSMDAMERADP